MVAQVKCVIRNHGEIDLFFFFLCFVRTSIVSPNTIKNICEENASSTHMNYSGCWCCLRPMPKTTCKTSHMPIHVRVFRFHCNQEQEYNSVTSNQIISIGVYTKTKQKYAFIVAINANDNGSHFNFSSLLYALTPIFPTQYWLTNNVNIPWTIDLLTILELFLLDLWYHFLLMNRCSMIKWVLSPTSSRHLHYGLPFFTYWICILWKVTVYDC